MDTENKEYLLGPLDPDVNNLNIRIKVGDFGPLTLYLKAWLITRYNSVKIPQENKDTVPDLPESLPSEFEFNLYEMNVSSNLRNYKVEREITPTFTECYELRIVEVASAIVDTEKLMGLALEGLEREKLYSTCGPQLLHLEEVTKDLTLELAEKKADLKILSQLRETAKSAAPLICDFKIWVNSHFSKAMWEKMLNARKQDKHRKRVQKKSVDINYDTWSLIDNIKRKEKVTFDEALVLICDVYHKQLGKEKNSN